MSSASADSLVQWFTDNEGSLRNVEVVTDSEKGGFGLKTVGSVDSGDTLLNVPFHLTMSVEACAVSPIAPVIQENCDVIPPDEALSLLLMFEKYNEGSRWRSYLDCLPKTFDHPVFWSEDKMDLLKGTMVHTLGQMMLKQCRHDWTNLIEPLVSAPPFSGVHSFCFEDYLWANAVIWSRAFGVTREGQYQHVLVPMLDMVNHGVLVDAEGARESLVLDDFVRFDEEKETVVLTAARSIAGNSEIEVSYGPYSNAKLLYSYGFVIPGNLYNGVDFWLSVPPSDPLASTRQQLIGEALGPNTFDFSGSLFPAGPSPRLLGILRVLAATEEELQALTKDPSPLRCNAVVSERNERAALSTLLANLRQKVQGPFFMRDYTVEDTSSGEVRLALQVVADTRHVFYESIKAVEAWIQKLDAEAGSYKSPTVAI